MKRTIVPIIMLLIAAFVLTAHTAAAGDKKYLNKPNAPVKKDSGRSLGTFPDVAPTPPTGPAGPIPTPYPNVDKTGETTKGSKPVKPGRKLSPGGIKEILPGGKVVPLLPEISYLSPLGCFVAGDKVSLGGKNFGSERGSRKLVLSYPVNRSRTISKPKWGHEKIIFTMPPGIPFNAAGRIGIREGKKTLADAEIFFCTEDHGMPDSGGSSGPKAVVAGQTRNLSSWKPPSWIKDGAVEEEKSSGEFGKMVMKKPPAMVPGTQTGPPLPDPRAASITAACTAGQRISATVTVANTAGVPTTTQAETEVSVIAKKRKPSKSPTPIWEDVKVVIHSHTTAAGFVGQESFSVEKAVPYFGNPKYTVRAKILVTEKEETGSNNSKGKVINCAW